MLIDLLQTIADMLASANYGMDADSLQYWNQWYWALGGETCTTNLDRVHQARYVTLYLLNVLAWAIARVVPFDPCMLAY